MSEFHDPGSGSGASLDRRVAVLEQIAADTRDALRELREDMRGQGRRLENLAADVADIKTDLGALGSMRNKWGLISTGWLRGRKTMTDAAKPNGDVVVETQKSLMQFCQDLLRDAERYRWLRDHCGSIDDVGDPGLGTTGNASIDFWVPVHRRGQTMDETIDAEIAREKETP